MKYRAVRVAGPLIERVEALSDYIRKDAERDGIPCTSLSRQVGIALAIGCAELEKRKLVHDKLSRDLATAAAATSE